MGSVVVQQFGSATRESIEVVTIRPAAAKAR